MQCIMLRKEMVRKMYLRASAWPCFPLSAHYQSVPLVELDACVRAGHAAQTFLCFLQGWWGCWQGTAGARIAAAQCQQIHNTVWQHSHMKVSVKRNSARVQYKRCNNCVCSAGSCWPAPALPGSPPCPEPCPAAQGSDAPQPRLSQGPHKLRIKYLQNSSRKAKQGNFILHHEFI